MRRILAEKTWQRRNWYSTKDNKAYSVSPWGGRGINIEWCCVDIFIHSVVLCVLLEHGGDGDMKLILVAIKQFVLFGSVHHYAKRRAMKRAESASDSDQKSIFWKCKNFLLIPSTTFMIIIVNLLKLFPFFISFSDHFTLMTVLGEVFVIAVEVNRYDSS